jgi:HSP20 family molecular chaperone IbpA
MVFYPERPTGDFVTLFRLLDDYDAHRSHQLRVKNDHCQAARTSSPKFNVKEANDSYLLDGELPGIAQSDIEIEFTDPYTLVIKGHVRREYNHTNAKDSAAKPESRPVSPKPHQPTVEDEAEVIGESSTPAVKSSEKQQVSTNDGGNTSQRLPFKYWVSERQVGEFHRTFTFPTRVNQDAVKANLKNGILSVIVPKAPAYTARKIQIQ